MSNLGQTQTEVWRGRPRWTPAPYYGMLCLTSRRGNSLLYGRMLINAFNIRLDSDYEVKLSLIVELAEDILRDAGQFVDRATTYLNQEGCV